MPEPLLDACDAAAARLDALTGAVPSVITMRDMTLAFVGFDVSASELETAASMIADNYGPELLDAFARTAAAREEDSFHAGMEFGVSVRRTLVGVFVYGVLAGELHREKARSDG